MKRLIGTGILLIGISVSGYSQEMLAQADSLQIRKQKGQTEATANSQQNQGQGNVQKNQGNGVQAVKRVRAGRPDMSKTRGARPPMIIRPSGSGMPKGVGKPGGAGRKVGR